MRFPGCRLARALQIVLSFALVSVTSGFAAPSPSPSAAPNPVYVDPALSYPVAKDARLRDLDGRKVLEYLAADSTAASPHWVPFGQVEAHPAGTRYYHWGPKDEVAKWVAKGLSDAELASWVNSVDPHDAAGGGLYASLDPLDSDDYGPEQLVLEPAHPATILANLGSYLNAKVAFEDNIQHALVPTRLLVKAGIEAVRYSSTWMVCIRSSMLEVRHEASWPDLLARPDWLTSFSALAFAQKYPLTPGIQASAEFLRALPVLAKTQTGAPIAPEELEAEATRLDQALQNGFDLQKYSLGLDPALVGKLLTALRPAMRSLFLARFQALRATAATDAFSYQNGFENKFLRQLQAFGIGLHEMQPELRSYLSAEYVIQSSSSYGGRVLQPQSPLLAGLQQNLGLYDFYPMLARLLKGDPTPWLDESAPAEMRAPGYSIFNALYPNSGPMVQTVAGIFQQVADLVAPGRSALRDFPLVSDGSHHLDGPGRPGYFLVTEWQKAALEATPYLVTRFILMKPAPGQPAQPRFYYAQYDYPSAANWQRITPALTDSTLVARLQAAESAGQLASADTSEFKTLTRDIITSLFNSGFGFGSGSTLLLSRLHPLADERAQGLAVRTYGFRMGARPQMLDPELPKYATFEEIAEASAITAQLGPTLSRALAPAPLDPAQALGIWEIAADQPGPHADPAAFVARVMSAFKSPEVQGLLARRDYAKIQRALHLAGAAAK